MFTTLSMKDFTFPENFLFGAGGAGHQIEGENIHSQFQRFETEHPEWFPLPAGKACDAWNRWENDADLYAGLGWKIYRMSIEWSRIEPEHGMHDEQALKRYIAMLTNALTHSE